MIAEIKEILHLVKELPHMVMWVLAGLLFYKVVCVGSVYGVIKLAIEKFSQYLMKDKKVTHEFSVEGFFITGEGNMNRFKRILGRIVDSGSRLNYIHSSDLDLFERAVEIVVMSRSRKVSIEDAAKEIVKD